MQAVAFGDEIQKFHDVLTVGGLYVIRCAVVERRLDVGIWASSN